MIDKEEDEDYIFEEFIHGESNINDANEDVSDMNYEVFTAGDSNIPDMENNDIMNKSHGYDNDIGINARRRPKRQNPIINKYEIINRLKFNLLDTSRTNNNNASSKISEFIIPRLNLFIDQKRDVLESEMDLSEEVNNGSVFMVNDKSKGNGNTTNNVKNNNNIFKNNSSDSKHVFSINIDIPEFRDEVLEKLKLIIGGIVTTDDIRELIWSRSCIVLDDLISMAMDDQLRISKSVNHLTVADAIIIRVIVSNENMPEYKVNFNTGGYNYYESHLKHLYPIINEQALKFVFKIPRGFNSIRDKFTTIIFEKFFRSDFDIDIDTSKIVKKLMKKDAYETILNENEVKIMERLLSRNLEKISKILMDLGETVKILFLASRNFKKIGALFPISLFADYLFNEGVDFLKGKKGFSKNVIQIYKHLQKTYPDLFPDHPKQKSHSIHEMQERMTVWRAKVKIYILKHIYNGKYCVDGKVCCPECVKEKGFTINTDILRLKALEFHHPTEKKDVGFTANAIYELFSKNRHRHDVLDYIIKQMEGEKVVLLCTNHHKKEHTKNIKPFDYLLNFKDLLSFPAEVIKILIYVAVDSHPEYKDSPKTHRQQVKVTLLRTLKKRHLISSIYGEYCHACGEVPVLKFISSFTFHHLEEDKKTVHASSLFSRNISEILEILVKERGTFICSNCHTIYHYKNLHLLDRIYEDQNDINDILEDYHSVRNNIIPINKNMSVDGIFQSDVYVNSNTIRYLIALFKLQEQEIKVTTKILREYLGVRVSSVHNFFNKSQEKNQFLERYISRKKINLNSSPVIYSLTSKGIELAELILNFRNYYQRMGHLKQYKKR